MTTTNQDVLLQRIANALERLAPQTDAARDWLASPAYVWTGRDARSVDMVDAPDLSQLRGIEAQKTRVVENVERFAAGFAAHDMLLWGARGMGKSALVRSAVAAAQRSTSGRIALVQVAQEALPSVTNLFNELRIIERQFLVYLDDLGFAGNDDTTPRLLRSWLEGGVEARPANVRLAVTSNRRAIVERNAREQDNPINPRDAVDDRLALADRFGLSVGFHTCSQDDYLAIIDGYANSYGIEYETHDALEWATRRGARSGRVAWQYVVELAGRMQKAI